MLTFTCVVHRYFGEDGYRKPSVIARFHIEAVDEEVADELAHSMVRAMPDVFVIVEEITQC